jgi:hypothetical protein
VPGGGYRSLSIGSAHFDRNEIHGISGTGH